MTDEARTHPLTIYLARPGTTALADLLDPSLKMAPYQIKIGDIATAELYIQVPSPKPPDWATFFDGYIPSEDFGENSSTSAVLLVETRGKRYALTFGHGRFLLNSDCWEDRFGLKVALNCIGDGKVRSINKHSLDQLLRHTQEQASRDASPREFGFDIEQDLLRAVAGTPSDARFGKRIAGVDSLHIAVPVNLNGLAELLGDISDKFLETTYKRNFPWVDHITEVTNPTLERELEDLLIKRINARQTDQIWMAVPELIDWQNVAGFRFPILGRSPEHHDIHLGNFISSLKGQPLTEETLQHRKVVAVDQNGETVYRWSAYKCLYAELEKGKHESFVLSVGRWYQVRGDFVHEVNAAYDNVPDYEETLPEFRHESEGDYLSAVAESDKSTFALMDQKLISYGGGHSKIEFCDLLTDQHDAFHVKRYGQASALSHLFAQGVVSGELFQIDAEFRKRVNEKLPKTHRLNNPANRPKLDQFRMVFAIVSDSPGPLKIPFFSRLNLKHAVRRLNAYGYRVAKAKISVESSFSKLQKYRKRERRRK